MQGLEQGDGDGPPGQQERFEPVAGKATSAVLAGEARCDPRGLACRRPGNGHGRHPKACGWRLGGDGPEDKAANDEAVKSGGRILSRYMSAAGEPFWIITEADRSATTVLMPEEY